MKECVFDLLKEQDKLNTIINPTWKDDRTSEDFKRAMIVESGELLEHTAFKWWKKQDVDILQSKMEIIDLWFFFFSLLILNINHTPSMTLSGAGRYENKLEFFVSMFSKFSGFRKHVEWDTQHVQERTLYFINEVSHGRVNLLSCMYELLELTTVAGITFDELYELYMGKLVLNIFRQEHGYSDGTYIKFWGDGLEDNQVLEKIISRTKDVNLIKQSLEREYNARMD
jgi:hypothetical protein